MLTSQWTSALIGFTLAAMIFYLIRRDHLHTRHALWWLSVAVIIAMLGMFPQLIDIVAWNLSIHYPPTLLLVLGLGLVLLKVLTIDIHQSQHERRLRRLVQRIALLEEELAGVTGKTHESISETHADDERLMP